MLRRSLKDRGLPGMSPTTSAGISVVGEATESSAASMSMADNSASPSIGPAAGSPGRSGDRAVAEGVAVTPPGGFLGLSANHPFGPLAGQTLHDGWV